MSGLRVENINVHILCLGFRCVEYQFCLYLQQQKYYPLNNKSQGTCFGIE